MKTKITIKTFFIALAACFMTFTVVLSASHAKDVARASHPADVSNVVSRAGDINVKAMGDLHTHIDKQTLKSISMDNPMTAREREIKAITDEEHARGILEIIQEMFSFYRLALAMRLSLVTA